MSPKVQNFFPITTKTKQTAVVKCVGWFTADTELIYTRTIVVKGTFWQWNLKDSIVEPEILNAKSYPQGCMFTDDALENFTICWLSLRKTIHIKTVITSALKSLLVLYEIKVQTEQNRRGLLWLSVEFWPELSKHQALLRLPDLLVPGSSPISNM